MSQLSGQLWECHQIRASRSILYECEKLNVVFGGDFSAFEDWIAETKAFKKRPVYWSDVREYCLGGRSNPDVIGREEADQRDYREAERGIDAIERILHRARQGEEEAQGVLEGIRQSIAGFLILADSSATETPRSSEYVSYVRSHPCAICRRPADAHHAFGRRGIGSKASDFTCVPLCPPHHMELHQIGRTSFERQYRVALMEIAFNLLHRFTAGTWVTLVLEGEPP